MELLWLLLPIAAASGWWAARRSAKNRNDSAVRHADYFKGLNYLIDDQPDQAIEVFTRIADVDRDTAEIHLALGNLFRRRGEVDRAIHIHGSLIARTYLTADQRQRAMLELGEDYLRAGLFDRAEELFQKLLDQPELMTLALSRLIHIFRNRLAASPSVARPRIFVVNWPKKRKDVARMMKPEPGCLRLWRVIPIVRGLICCWGGWPCGLVIIRPPSPCSNPLNDRIAATCPR